MKTTLKKCTLRLTLVKAGTDIQDAVNSGIR